MNAYHACFKETPINNKNVRQNNLIACDQIIREEQPHKKHDNEIQTVMASHRCSSES